MALSYFTESEAPRDFRVSSTESDGHYTKCVLCYTVKKNFYCAECIRTGNFVQSSMPYSDRFAEKQAKLLRIKANRKHVLDRCDKLLANKLKKDKLLTEAKMSRDKLDLLKLAIEQRQNNIAERKKELTELKQYNEELNLKLPRYQKRVAGLVSHSQHKSIELQNKISSYSDQAQSLAALRRSRIRQLTKYIFPVSMSYDISDSIEDIEIVGDVNEENEEPQSRTQLHIVAPWINTDEDFSHIATWMAANKEWSSSCPPSEHPWRRCGAALALAAQLAALLAWALDARLPHALPLSEYSNWRLSAAGWSRRARRVSACCAALCMRAARTPPPAPSPSTGPSPTPAPTALAALHALALAAHCDDPALGRIEGWVSEALAAACEEWWVEGEEPEDGDPPEHLHWPEPEQVDEARASGQAPAGAVAAPAPSASLVTSAAGALASMWRGWTK